MTFGHFHKSNTALKKKKGGGERRKEETDKKKKRKERKRSFFPTTENILQNGISKWILYYTTITYYHWGRLAERYTVLYVLL